MQTFLESVNSCPGKVTFWLCKTLYKLLYVPGVSFVSFSTQYLDKLSVKIFFQQTEDTLQIAIATWDTFWNRVNKMSY